MPKSDFSFVQISDSHIGFNKAANPDVTYTLQAAIAKINAMPMAPKFILHNLLTFAPGTGRSIRHPGPIYESHQQAGVLCSGRA